LIYIFVRSFTSLASHLLSLAFLFFTLFLRLARYLYTEDRRAVATDRGAATPATSITSDGSNNDNGNNEQRESAPHRTTPRNSTQWA